MDSNLPTHTSYKNLVPNYRSNPLLFESKNRKKKKQYLTSVRGYVYHGISGVFHDGSIEQSDYRSYKKSDVGGGFQPV